MVIRGRRIWMAFHRWLGLVAGVLIAVLGITGSILVFETEIDSALNPTLMQVEPQGTQISFDAIIDAATAANPGWTARYLERVNDDPHAAYKVVMRDAALAEKQVFVNPYTGAVLGERSGLSPIVIVRRIHADLVLGKVGENIVGVFSFVCVFFFVAGIVLWWPAKGGARRAFLLSGSTEPKRLMRELHNVSGIWLSVFFVLAALTVPPLVWTFSPPAGGGPPPGAGAPPQAAAARPTDGERPQGPAAEQAAEISWQAAADIAAREVPDQYIGFILRNPGPRGLYMVRFWEPGQTGVSNMTNVFVAINSGRVLRKQSPQVVTAQSVLQADFSASIHSGAILGLPGRWIMFAAGLFLPVLFVTGIVMWVLGRRRKLSS